MSSSNNASQAILDFQEARRKADLRAIFSRFSGESISLLSYEEIRQNLRAIEGNQKKLEDIPLDAIVGSVGRYTDFTRDFLPLHDSDQHRWSQVMAEALGSTGLPPIEVYRIGDVYFVMDGNHRVSVARQLEATHIQAYVTEVRSRVPFTPDFQPDQLIIIAEHVNFVEHTQIDKLRPEANLMVTNPGQYPILEEHISVHRYFMGLNKKRDIPSNEAVTHWYDKVYLPVIKTIRSRGMLESFPERTETDLYLWISRHQAELKSELGWKIDTETVASDLVFSFAPDFIETMGRIAVRILDIVIPDQLESGPSVGHWRHKYIEKQRPEHLFKNLLVALSADLTKWQAFSQALIIAQKEGSQIRGLHVVAKDELEDSLEIEKIRSAFYDQCNQNNIPGDLAVDSGKIARQICERAHWADLIVMNLNHPPGDAPFDRLGSGFRTVIRRCARPILAVPRDANNLERILLAYSDSPKAEEALFIAAYLASKWNKRLSVLTVEQEGESGNQIQKHAQIYLQGKNIEANYIHLEETENIAQSILETAENEASDLLLIGGYKASPIVEVFLGSLVDQILREIEIPVWICR